MNNITLKGHKGMTPKVRLPTVSMMANIFNQDSENLELYHATFVDPPHFDFTLILRLHVSCTHNVKLVMTSKQY